MALGRTEMPIREDFLVPADPHDPKAANVPKLTMNWRWVQFWGDFFTKVDAAPIREGRVTLVQQAASIPVTPIPIAQVGAGIYRLTYYQEVLTVAGVSSSLTPTFRWTSRGVAKSFSGVAMNGNLLTTYQQDTIILRADKDSVITYEEVYASNPGGAMKYGLDIQLERVKLDTQ